MTMRMDLPGPTSFTRKTSASNVESRQSDSGRWERRLGDGRQLGSPVGTMQRADRAVDNTPRARAEFTLAEVESSPDALPGPVTSPAVGDDAACRGNATGDGALQESPQGVSSDAHASDFVSKPYTEGATTTRAPLAIVAKDPPSTNGPALRVAFVVAAQKAVAIQRANRFTMRTRRLLEAIGYRVPVPG